MSEDKNEDFQSFNVKDFIWLCLSKWYWFVISLAVCCGVAAYVVMKTPKIYTRTASVLVKDDRLNSKVSGDLGSSFTGMSMVQTNTNVQNEMETIKSPIIMSNVVRNLGLDVSYTTPGTFYPEILYGPNLPLELSFPDIDENAYASLTADVDPNGKVVFSNFLNPPVSQEPSLQQISAVYNKIDTIQSPLGRIAIRPNAKFSGSLEAPLHIDVAHIGVKAAAASYGAALTTEILGDYTSIIEMTVNDRSIARAEDLLNSVIEVYNENWIREKNQMSRSTSQFIAERLSVIESELGNVDSDISSYKSSNLLPDVQTASQLFFTRTNAASEAIADLNNRISAARYVRDFLANSANNFNVLPAGTGLSDVNIGDQIANYNRRLLERNKLVANSSTSNPIVVDIDNQLIGIRQSMLQALDNHIVLLNNELRETRSAKASSDARLAANPTQAKYLLSVERQQKVKEALYLYLLNKREENELSQAFTAYNTRIINPPMGSNAPVLPQPRNIFSVALLIGLVIPLGLIYLKEMLNTTVRGRRDLDALSVPFLGEIPLGYKPKSGLLKAVSKRNAQDQRVVMVKKGSHNVINEAFRVLRTNLEFMTDVEETNSHTIMVTSANPGSGKTFITVNLGSVLAIKDKRVAVIDLDLRKGSLSEMIGNPSKGITNYLVGQVSLDDIIVKNAFQTEGLDVVPVGVIPPNPAELLYSPRLKQLIDTLRQNHDFILIDCPPVEVVADAKIINRHVDMTVFIVRAGLLEREMLSHIQHFYDTQRYHNLAIILNGTYNDSGVMRNRYGYGYGTGYGYGYGYGYGKKNNGQEEEAAAAE